MKQAGIYVNDVFCGILTEDEEGFHFSYDGAYLTRDDAMPVSPTMPLTEKQYDNIWYLTGGHDRQEDVVGKNGHILI